ncbi:hypothetical protein H0N96_01095 [Candidatus Micrarchaeota archaeon]|nr:hypothetical protein [Candidatus Micrarchaeota archaeon]
MRNSTSCTNGFIASSETVTRRGLNASSMTPAPTVIPFTRSRLLLSREAAMKPASNATSSFPQHNSTSSASNATPDAFAPIKCGEPAVHATRAFTPAAARKMRDVSAASQPSAFSNGGSESTA